jgi:hypothetical protein
VNKETYNLVHLLVNLCIFDNARYNNQNSITQFLKQLQAYVSRQISHFLQATKALGESRGIARTTLFLDLGTTRG